MAQTTLPGRIALVTGEGRGIGKAIALALADAGCDVAVNYVSREADADGACEGIRAKGRRALAIRGDVSKSADVTTLVSAVEAGLGVHYSAAKAGVIAATKSYARMLAKEGVTVNAISPALIATEMVASNPNVKPDMIPVGRFGRVEECGDVAVLLAGNPYITGQTIGVNGGMYLAS
jgi:NAD(P)-dependent dehydrogenase (short-subunit alcohol dehydrogenase family)